MKLYIDNATNTLVTSATLATTPTITLFKEDISSVEIRFVENGSVVDIGTPTIRLALGKDGGLIAFTDSWTKNGTGATAYWTGSFNLNTQQAEMVLAGLSSTEAILEVEVRQGTSIATKAQISVTLKTDLINETDTATDIGNIVTIGASHIAGTTNVHGIANTANLVLTNDARLSDTRDPKTHTHTISDVTGLQAAIGNSGIKAGVQWTTRHTTSTGNPYVVGSIVYNAGRVYRCLATNDSIPPVEGGNLYWADLGVGYLLPNENPKIQGGNIEISGGASIVLKTGTSGDEADGGNGGAILQVGGNSILAEVITGEDENGNPIYEGLEQPGGNAGYLWQNGADGGSHGVGGSAGWIKTDAFEGNSGGSIDISAGEQGNGGGINLSNNGGSIRMYGGSGYSGGSISTFAGGGSINTTGRGSIQFGLQGQRTTLNGSVVLGTGDKTITLPNATGTIALTNDPRFTDSRTPTAHTHAISDVLNLQATLDGKALSSHTHGNITNDGKIPFSTTSIASITATGSLDSLVNGIYIVTQGANVSASVTVGGTTGAKTLTPAGSGTGYANGSATINGSVGLGTSGSANVNIVIGPSYAYGQPLMTGNNGVVGLSSFGTTANTFCQGNDVRLGAQTIFTLGGEAKTTFALGTSYLYGCMPTRGPQLSGSYLNAVLKILGNFSVTGISIHQYLPSATTATLTYQLVRVTGASSFDALGSSIVVVGNNNLTTTTSSLSASINNGDQIGLMLTLGASGSVPSNTFATTILANLYCVPR